MGRSPSVMRRARAATIALFARARRVKKMCQRHIFSQSGERMRPEPKATSSAAQKWELVRVRRLPGCTGVGTPHRPFWGRTNSCAELQSQHPNQSPLQFCSCPFAKGALGRGFAPHPCWGFAPDPGHIVGSFCLTGRLQQTGSAKIPRYARNDTQESRCGIAGEHAGSPLLATDNWQLATIF